MHITLESTGAYTRLSIDSITAYESAGPFNQVRAEAIDDPARVASILRAIAERIETATCTTC